MDHNGGSVIAMVGKDCVAIAADTRLGNQALGISSNFQRVSFDHICYCHYADYAHRSFLSQIAFSWVSQVLLQT